jgi:exopolyphosphatase/pppGpp-phosphohydrolase
MGAQSSPESTPSRTEGADTRGIEAGIRLRYSATRSGVADGVPATVLHIGAEQTAVASGSGIEPAATIVLAIGSRKTAADYFKHDPPTPVEMENAIAAVEDEVSRARRMIAGDSALFTADAAVREIAHIAGVTGRTEMILTRDAMDQTFERMARATLGRPASREGIPAGATFVATLLILREFMHHLQFLSITVTAPRTGATSGEHESRSG